MAATEGGSGTAYFSMAFGTAKVGTQLGVKDSIHRK